MPREPRDLSLIDGEYRMGRSLTGRSETIDMAARVAETW